MRNLRPLKPFYCIGNNDVIPTIIAVIGAVNDLGDPAMSDHVRAHEARLGGAVQNRLFKTANLQGFNGLLACQHFGMPRQDVSGRQLLDTFSDDFAAKNNDTSYRSISLRLGLAS